MGFLAAWLPKGRGPRAVALGLVAFLILERLLLIFGVPDLLADLDMAELKLMDLALFGLPDGNRLIDRLHTFLSGPESIHHGGYAVVSLLFWGLSSLLGESLEVLRLIPITASLVAMLCVATFLRRRVGDHAALLSLVIFAGAPPLFLKWSCTARGGHTEAIVLGAVLLLVLERAVGTPRRSPWFVAGLVGGFSVYFSYLMVPSVLLLSAGALLEARRRGGSGARIATLALGGLVGFLPWILGLLVLDLPYLDSLIHQTSNPEEAREVVERGVVATLAGAVQGLPHNLWPWTMLQSDAAAYRAEPNNLITYRASTLDWAVRSVICLAALFGLAAARRRRSPLMAAVCLLAPIHLLFVVRLTNTFGWPDIAHRYLVLAFPAIPIACALGAADLLERRGRWRRGGQILVGLLVVIGLTGAVRHGAWFRLPQPKALSAWDAGEWRRAGIGQVRLAESEGIAALLARFPGEANWAGRRGVALVYEPEADYYLLFRPSLDRPYPSEIFRDADSLLNSEADRQLLVRGALEATRFRAGGDRRLLETWVCSWTPEPHLAEIVGRVRREEEIDCEDE